LSFLISIGWDMLYTGFDLYCFALKVNYSVNGGYFLRLSGLNKLKSKNICLAFTVMIRFYG
jgi:hypothetical protein